MMNDELKRKKSLSISLYKGMYGCIMVGFIQEYFTPFILFLGATAMHVGILNSLSNLSASLIQLASADVARWLGSRKKTVGIMVILQAFILAGMTGFAFGHVRHYGFFIFLVVLFTAFGSLFHPVWASLLSDLVDVNKRGAYFGWRSRVLGLTTVAAMGLAGVIVHAMEAFDTAYGFGIIFAAGLCCRLMSYYYLERMDEPPLQYKREDQFSFFKFFARVRQSNFVKFVLFVAAMNFSVNLAAPFFAVLMIRDLGFSYLLYTVIIIIAPLTLYLTVERWGQHADRVGNLKCIRLTAKLISTLPLLWIISREPLYLIVVEMFSGFLWAGFNLCTINFIFDVATPEKRTRCIAYFSVVNGMALAAGAFVGGSIINILPPLFGYKILTLFLIATVLRFAVSIFLVKMVKEVRHTESIKSTDLFFSMIGWRPILGIDRRRL